MGKWLEFYKEHEPSNMKEKMKIICTMDVEAFQEKDARSAHTSNKDYLQRLIYGYEKENEVRGGRLKHIIEYPLLIHADLKHENTHQILQNCLLYRKKANTQVLIYICSLPFLLFYQIHIL